MIGRRPIRRRPAGPATPKGLPDRPLATALATAVLLAMMAVLPGLPARADSGSAQTTVGLIVLGTPALAATKRGTAVDTDRDGRIGPGDRVHWTITVSNTGNTVVSAVTVHDPTAGPVRCPATSLLPKQATTCTVPDHTITAADVAAGVITNVAHASAAAQGGQVIAPAASASVPIPPVKPIVVLPPPPWLPGFPGGLPHHPDFDGPDFDGPGLDGPGLDGRGPDGPVVGGAVVGGGAVAGGSGPGSGSGTGPGSGSGGGPGRAEPGSSHRHGGASPAPGGQQDAHPPVAVAGGQPDEPGRSGLELVVLGTVTAGCALAALAALGALGARRTRRRR
ncbi:hypothetical protein ND748_12745 [Frankia sp. AiPs1]|uniref:DUF7507 domain-containing protein n=1 Tax=Frankia sp. AiPs1 TaxID=573493 RepID=UPI002043DA51|nr:hypothetical protein [Frankia sp. AiPs1]MCM3922523.1 hypothetical protein [Frankia sp. AiPs1]